MTVNDRAVSTVVGYTMLLGIVALLTTGLVLSMGGFVDGHADDRTQSTLEVLTNTLAADVNTADRLVQSTDNPTTITVATDLPERVAGHPYEITIEDAGTNQTTITLRSESSDVFATVTVRTETAIAPTTVDGGDVEIRYDVENESLAVDSR